MQAIVKSFVKGICVAFILAGAAYFFWFFAAPLQAIPEHWKDLLLGQYTLPEVDPSISHKFFMWMIADYIILKLAESMPADDQEDELI